MERKFIDSTLLNFIESRQCSAHIEAADRVVACTVVGRVVRTFVGRTWAEAVVESRQSGKQVGTWHFLHPPSWELSYKNVYFLDHV